MEVVEVLILNSELKFKPVDPVSVTPDTLIHT